MARSGAADPSGNERRGPSLTNHERSGTTRRRSGRALLLLLAAAMALPAEAAQQGMGELVDRSALRVCADPSSLPFSDEAGQGFENKIAALMAERLGVPVTYTWYPNSLGFIRHTLKARLCDLVMGVVAADELTQNTNPYYRSTYVLLVRAGEEARFGDLASPLMRTARIGVVAGTPPADIAVRQGLAANLRPYDLMTDTRVVQPARNLVEDLAAGQLDVGLLWGPIAGYWATRQSVALTMVPLPSDPRAGLRMDFRISMGIRPDEPEWKRVVNELIRDLQPKITAILQDYGVPLLDEQGRLIGAAAPTAAALPGPATTPAVAAVEEPLGYRTDRYRAPVPATLEGATVLDAQGLKVLLAEQRPVLIDVLPKQRRPPGRDPAQLWIEPKRKGIPGSVWLPNVGLGELPPETAAWLERQLHELTGGDKARPLVFYCDSNCWMSWNAAKRAMLELGYGRVYWLPEGVQGWKAAGQELVDLTALEE